MYLRRKNLVVLPIVLCCLSAFQVCTGLRCYQCQWMNGLGQRECLQEPPPSRFLMECNQPQCWKKYSHYNGNTNVQRYCVAVADERSSCRRSTYEDMYTGEAIPAVECTCKSDGCNGSSRRYHQSSANYNGVMLVSIGIVVFSRIAVQDLLR